MNENEVPVDDPVLREAKKRFNRVAEWEAAWRPRYIDDVKFAAADSDNGFQWKDSIRRNRDVDNRPCLTMNVVRQHNLQISNSMLQNKTDIKILAVGNDATVEAARVYSDLIRYYTQQSNAQDAFERAVKSAVDGGRGWWRIITKYVSTDSFDQDPTVLPIADQLSVYMDPDIVHKDGRDAEWAFVFDDVPQDQWDEAYPQWAALGRQPLGVASMDDDWVSKDYIRVCEYFRKVRVKDELISFVHLGQRKTIYKSMLSKNMLGVLDAPSTRVRPIEREKIEWYLIAGNEVIDSTEWPGKYIPLVRVVGEEQVFQGVYDCWGHTRKIKDPQRMYNWNASAQVEFVALQGKTPWLAPAKAIEELETMWNSANVANHSVLLWNHVDDNNPDVNIPPPMRIDPPNFSAAYANAMETSFNQMMMASGQWQNQMGMMGNERTGSAIGKRMEQGDTATYHFQNNYESALKFTAEIFLDLIPRVVDTERAMTIMNETGEMTELTFDPNAKSALQQRIASDGRVLAQIFNPLVGRYTVAPTVGPAYGSKREEAVEKMGLLLAEAPTLMPLIGDLVIGSMDFDKAQEAAQRLRRMIPPAALGQGPTQNEQALGARNTALTNALSKALQDNAKGELKLVGKDQMRDIDAYEANTKRLGVVKEMLPFEPAALTALITKTVSEAIGQSLGGVFAANANDLDEDGPPVAGATRAGDGEWYVRHPSGGYLRVRRKSNGRQ